VGGWSRGQASRAWRIETAGGNQAIDLKAKGQAAVLVSARFLSMVPDSLGHDLGSSRLELEFDVIGLVTTKDGPGVAEVGPQIKVFRNGGDITAIDFELPTKNTFGNCISKTPFLSGKSLDGSPSLPTMRIVIQC